MAHQRASSSRSPVIKAPIVSVSAAFLPASATFTPARSASSKSLSAASSSSGLMRASFVSTTGLVLRALGDAFKEELVLQVFPVPSDGGGGAELAGLEIARREGTALDVPVDANFVPPEGVTDIAYHDAILLAPEEGQMGKTSDATEHE